MIDKKEISMYLKYGFTQDLSYGDPIKIDRDISFDDCVYRYKELYEKSLNSLNKENVLYALSGGLDSSLNVYYLRQDDLPCYCYIIEGNLDHRYAEKIAKLWGLKNFFLIDGVDINNLEEDLIAINQLWDKPKCITTDLHTYDMMLKLKKYSDVILSGLWAEILCLGFGHIYGPIMETAYIKGEYDISLAQSIFDGKYGDIDYQKYFNIDRAKNRHYTYSEVLSNKDIVPFVIFSDEQIKGFGFNPPTIKLREETLSHALQAMLDWFHPYVGTTYPILEKNAGIKYITPFELELRDFCLSIPYEYKFCMGIERYVQRKFMYDIGYPSYLLKRRKEGLQAYQGWWDLYYKDIVPLMEKYLNRHSLIFEFIDYDYFKKEFENFTYYQKWVLLNLSIWFYRRMYV